MPRGFGNKKGTFETKHGLPPSVIRVDKRKDRPRSNVKTPTTVASILTSDNVKDCLQYLYDKQTEIDEIICIYTTKDEIINWNVTDNLTISKAIFMIERIKHILLLEMDGEE